MIVGLCLMTLHLHGVRSLKEKRSLMRRLFARISKELNAGIAEVGHNDAWNSAQIAITTVNLSEAVVRGIFRKAESLAESTLGVEVIDINISLL